MVFAQESSVGHGLLSHEPVHIVPLAIDEALLNFVPFQGPQLEHLASHRNTHPALLNESLVARWLA